MKFLQELLRIAGYDPERLRLEWISAGEGTRFAEVIADFTEQIRKLGPSAARPDLVPDAEHILRFVNAGS